MDRLVSAALALGASKASVINTDEIMTDSAFRDICATNSCGMYGRCYMCPPDCGNIETLMEKIREYDHMLVYQTVDEIEDSYDFEGMVEAKSRFNAIVKSFKVAVEGYGLSCVLCLGAGGCICPVCAKATGEPCRHPDLAVASLEAYGINVSELARVAGMQYVNGPNTVTYFGGILFSTSEERNEKN